MANFEEQVLIAWEEWEAITGADANNPDDFIVWAMEERRSRPLDTIHYRNDRQKHVNALRQALRTDEVGFSYRAKQCVTVIEEGMQLRLWFDTDRGGTPNLRQKAIRQRRERNCQ